MRNVRTFTAVITVAICSPLFVSGLAAAAQPANSGTSTAKKKCVTLSKKGTRIPCKFVGKPGADGAQGAAGANGSNGSNGNDGANGEHGKHGASAFDIWHSFGNQGDESDFLASLMGKDGKDGIDGNDGATGPTGPQGLAGPAGPQGEDGETGPQGPVGAKGADSTVAGPQGETGPEGPVGPKGADSTVAGPQGETGPEGPAGPQGPASLTTTSVCSTSRRTIRRRSKAPRWLATPAKRCSAAAHSLTATAQVTCRFTVATRVTQPTGRSPRLRPTTQERELGDQRLGGLRQHVLAHGRLGGEGFGRPRPDRRSHRWRPFTCHWWSPGLPRYNVHVHTRPDRAVAGDADRL